MPITDMLGTSDSMLGNMSFGEGTTYQGQVFNESASNSLSLSQTVARLLTSNLSTSSTLASLSDVAVEIFRGRGNAVDTLILVGTVGVKHYWKIDVGQSIFISQSVVDGASFQRSLSQSLILTQIANVSIPITISQSLSLSDSAIVIYSKFAANVLTLSHTVSLTRTVNKTVLDDTLIPKFAGSPPHPQIRGLAQKISGNRSSALPETSILSIGQHVDVQLSHAQNASNVLVLSQEMYQIRTDENDASALVLDQAVTVKKVISRSVSHTLALGQTTKSNSTPVTLSVTQTLVFKESHDRPTGISSMPIVTIPSGYVVKVPDVRPPDPCYPYRGKLTLLEIPGTSVILPTAEFNDSQSFNGSVTIKRSMSGKRRVYHRKMGIAQKLRYDFIIDRRKAIELRQFIIQANSIPIKLTNWKGEVWQVLLTNNPLTFTEESYWGPGWNASSGNKSSISLEFEGARIN